MEPGHRRRRRAHTADEAAAVLRKAWCRLRLSARDPARVPPWDAVVLTAASPEQAALYDRQLARARRLARFPPSTAALAVPDPDGARIGSGAATLHAVASLVRHLLSQATKEEIAEFLPEATGSSADDVPLASVVRFMATKHVLLLHAGGDSKRVPWANPMGKAFLPVPYLAGDNPDGPVPLLFDHILAVSASARQAFKNQGGIFIMTGDVLPCFDASNLLLPDDAACIVTAPTTLDVASNHGVVVASKDGTEGENYSLCLVDDLLQKPTVSELVEGQAILDDGRALLDTGIIAVRGKAWQELVALAYSSSQTMIKEIITSRKELSLYEDLVAGWVPAKHEWLRNRPFGKELIAALGRQKMFSFCSYDFSFLHFGTSAEVLDHLAGSYSGLVGRRHMCSVPETTACDIAATTVILCSRISAGVSIGEDSLVYDSSLSGRVRIGSQSIVVGVNIHELHHGNSPQIMSSSTCFTLPDRHCLWEVPLVNSMGRVMVYCGLHDNPKVSMKRDGTFCGKPWKNVLEDLKIQDTDMWDTSNLDKCLWNARLFPIMSPPEMLNVGMWLMGSGRDPDGKVSCMWRKSRRVSLEELHRSIDYHQLCRDSAKHQADLTAAVAKSCVTYGLLGRNLFQLCEEMLGNDSSSVEVCKELLTFFPSQGDQYPGALPQSRGYQVKSDLLRASGDLSTASMVEEKVWASVASETASAIKYGSKEPSSSATTSSNGNLRPKKAVVELPVRVDFVGGWSDTPPWSLERPGCVLNMAISLEGRLPVGATIEATEDHHGVLVEDDAARKVYIEDLSSISCPFKEDDPFRLVKSALIVTGILGHEMLSTAGLKIRTWAKVPRGSGLGTSSILAAAVVKCLFQLMEDDGGDDNVARAVLVVEQIMGTGGGWQDQIGGLYPGIKCTQSFPGQPLRLQVVPLLASPQLIQELEQRLLVVFTGQVRLAHRVLEKVVTRYLRRDSLLISSIRRLAELARAGREALMNGEVDELGGIMLEAWGLHQELDPFCSNKLVDELFALADPYCCGYKLVGAGGGGFALLLARSPGHAVELRRALRDSMAGLDVTVYDWNVAVPLPR
ncbi:bifunctional fucokinase/fucose pyrophosphorylase isoform X1 [Hordeum vulgare subsp. vulgare]|uniref:Bifunctional fucokinase/fucose pyrophosphorylase n=2 Tax=Hordeum vulgare subsp. vulgare TaxID=112509 RepID=A0A8I6X697_HORVV|nr:bifunctional fucokinase/fucose pyrophosphorylase isoform X1 [Hordeum vulgare subsp. vulgare]